VGGFTKSRRSRCLLDEDRLGELNHKTWWPDRDEGREPPTSSLRLLTPPKGESVQNRTVGPDTLRGSQSAKPFGGGYRWS